MDKSRDWPATKVRAELVARNISLRSISREAKLHEGAASTALRRPFPRAEAAIAKALGMEPFQIWPSRYPAILSAIKAVAANAAGATPDAGGRRLKVPCPICGGNSTVVRAAEPAPGIRELTYRCVDPACGHAFLMQLAHVRTVAPRKGRRK